MRPLSIFVSTRVLFKSSVYKSTIIQPGPRLIYMMSPPIHFMYISDGNGWVSSRFPTVCTPQIHDPRVMNM